ncbi:hypothetical protein O9X98_13890 [Agrobacterium salinitolerans]|nr:hypothetical protein [Agrobacterium salinitolerans]
MNKSQVGRGLAGAFSKYNRWESVACAAALGAVLSGAVVFFALLSHLGVRPPRELPASYEFIASSIICLFGSVALKWKASESVTVVKEAIKSVWLTLYKGTEWMTPAGEKGTVSDVNVDANELEILFEDGKKHRLPLRYLTPVNTKGPEADFSDLKTDGSVDWEYYGSKPIATSCTVMFLGLLAVLGWSVFHTDIPAWSALPIAVALIFGGFIPLGLLLSKAPFYRVDDFAFPALVSKTTWKAFDGRVGVVRWAKRKYEGDSQYSETILLAFPEGDEEWFRRGDLKATAFEC